MRTNVVIDDSLMKKALKTGGYRTKRAAIEDGLRMIVRVNSQQKLRGFRGQGLWEGDLEKMRRD